MRITGERKTKLHRIYPIWLHVLHLIVHITILVCQTVTFYAMPQSSNESNSSSELPDGPGWRFRFTTSWIIHTLILYMFAAFLFDIILILRGLNDSLVKVFKIHLDRFFGLMFATSHGMGAFYHVLFFIACGNNSGCPSYTEYDWFIHLMPFWYSSIEFLVAPHKTKRDFKTVFFLPCIFCSIYFINYWLFVAQTHGHSPYATPWVAWRWISYFCIPLAVIYLRLIDYCREWLFYKRLLRAWCIYPPAQFIENRWLGWHPYYCPIDQTGMQPIDWKALIAMACILLVLVATWNILYLVLP